MPPDERHYNVKKLNILFAISAVILFVSMALMFIKDYDRPWKKYQQTFRTMEVEKTRVKFDKESIALEGQQEYVELNKKFQEAKAVYDKNCSHFQEVESEIAKLKAEYEIVNQEYKFNRAEVDAFKYRYEHARAHQEPATAELQKKYEGFAQKDKDLAVEVERLDESVKAKTKVIDQCASELKELERQQRKLATQRDLYSRKLAVIDPNEMSFANKIADMTRDLPIIDLANPNNKIEQVVLKDLRDDVNFMTVPKVERCTTCHLGVTNPDYKDADQPFRTHPDLELYVGKDSPHPIEEFGCTTCHGGRARGTDFNSAVHVPQNDAQKKKWEKKHGYHQIELWEDPMLPLQFTQAGCFKCHTNESRVKGAEKLNLGLNLIEKKGCYNCHYIEHFKDWPKSGPDLTRLSSKLSKDWAYKWIHSPQAFRHNTNMPAFFNQSNNSDPQSKKRAEQEIHAIVHYLFENSAEFHLNENNLPGDIKKGEALVASLGCFACHNIDPKKEKAPLSKERLDREFGPNLIGLGSKTSKQWLFNWLKDPKRYHSQTRMPSLRLSDQEAADVAEYLAQDHNSKFENEAVPPLDENELNGIVLPLLKKSKTDDAAKAELSSMSTDQKLSFAGKRLIGHYGCYSCHNIKGFDKVKPIGVELTEEGSKSLHKLDFGFVHIEHSKHAWFNQKLKDPRAFDKDKEKTAEEKLIMPNFYLEDDEAKAITTALLGFVDKTTAQAKTTPRTPENLKLEAGQKIISKFNCQACHKIDQEGGAIASTVTDWLIKYEGNPQADAEKFTESFSPPNLYGIGKKANPQWLFDFIHSPEQIVRPWLKMRMPTFGFDENELNSLINYFQTLDANPHAFMSKVDVSLTTEEFQAAQQLFSKENFDCMQCHVVGGLYPSGTKDKWAPDLEVVKDKINPHWLVEWIKDPQKLVPGTKMPTFFDPSSYENSGPETILNGDENEQIRVLRNFLMTLSQDHVVVSAPPAGTN